MNGRPLCLTLFDNELAQVIVVVIGWLVAHERTNRGGARDDSSALLTRLLIYRCRAVPASKSIVERNRQDWYGELGGYIFRMNNCSSS